VSSATETAPVSDADKKFVAVSCQLTQSYRVASPLLLDDVRLATVFNGTTNRTEMFLIRDVSTSEQPDLHVFWLGADGIGDTGWRLIDLAFPGQAAAIMAGVYPDGSRIVFVVDTNDLVYSRRMGQDADEPWHQHPAAPNPAPQEQIERIWAYAVLYDHANTPVPTFLLATESFTEGWIAKLEGDNWSILPTPSTSETGAGLTAFIATAEDAGAFGAYRAVGPYNARSLIADTGNSNPPAIAGNFTVVACVRNQSGFDDAIVTDDGNKVWYMAFDGARGHFTPTEIVSLSGKQPSRIVAKRMSDGMLDVFMTDASRHLFHTRQDARATGGWSQLLPLDRSLTFGDLYAGQNRSDQAEIMAIETAGDDGEYRIWRIWRDAIIPDQDDPIWHFDLVEMGDTQQVEEIRAYVAQVVVYDAQQNLLPNTAVKIFSDDGVRIDVNGVVSYLDAAHPLQVTSNALGRVLITLPTDALGVPALAIWTSTMDPTHRVVLDLSAAVQAELAGSNPAQGITGPDLLNATMKDQDGNPTLPLLGAAHRDPTLAANIAQAINRSVSMLNNAGTHKAIARPEFFHPSNDNRITKYVSRSDGEALRLLHRPSMADQAWRVSFASGKPQFSDLTHAEASTLVAQARTLTALSSGWGWSWSDVFHAIKSGLATVYEYVVQPVVDAVEATITLVINGAQYVFNCAVKLVEQVFDLVEQLMQQVAVAFDDLVSWLGEVLGWASVLRTKEVIKSTILELLKLAERGVPALEGVITGKLGDFEATLVKRLDDFNKLILGSQTTVGANRQRATDSMPADAARDMQRASSLNVLHSELINNFDRITKAGTPNALPLPPQAAATLDEVMTALTAKGTQFQAAPAFEELNNHVSQYKTQPENFLQTSVSLLVSLMKAVAQLVLEAAIELIHLIGRALLAALQAFVAAFTDTTTWSIPFVSAIYKKVVGSDLSPLDLSALMLALPTTLIYRWRYAATPFPDDGAVQRFQAAFNADAMWQRSGLGGPSNALARNVAPAALAFEEQSVVGRVFAIANTTNNFIFMFVDFFLDLQIAPGLTNPNEFGDNRNNTAQITFASWLAIANGWAAQVCSFPWTQPSQGPKLGCGNHKEFGAIHWVVQVVNNVFDTCWLLWSGTMARSGDLAGPWLSSAFGVTDLILSIVEGVWAAIEHDGNPLGTLESVFAAIPASLKFLHSDPIAEASECTSIVLLLFIDACCDAAAFGFSAFGVATSTDAALAGGRLGSTTLTIQSAM
jgi:hypothetical protein